MLRKEQNDLVTQTGPGTPMGRLFRATGCRSCSPRNCRKTTARRCASSCCPSGWSPSATADGRYGLIDEFCAHRGVSLWFGRNEECGLRCPYHGWKFDVTGQCVEVPSEPEESGFAKKIKLQVLSAGRARRRAVDLYGAARAPAAAAGMGIRDGAGRAALRLEAAAGMQLAAGDGRRHRFQPRLLPASRQHQLRSAVQGRQGQPVQSQRRAAGVRGGRERRRPLTSARAAMPRTATTTGASRNT